MKKSSFQANLDRFVTRGDLAMAAFLLAGLVLTDLSSKPVFPDACTRDGVVPPLHQTALPSPPEAADPARVQRVTFSPTPHPGARR